ncbi:MAG: hypothetical protein K2N13_07700 [Paraprevotella sp.]|nr:hypothetical protein [Paraprevotella sp.]
MRSLLFTLLLPLVSLTATAQINLHEYDNPDSPAPLLKQAARFGKSFPQEKVFLHLDNSCYYLGDTIWFKAYVTRTDSRTPTNLSKLLYVELMTPDGFLYQRKIVPLEQGSGKGAVVLADSLYGGFYELRAYTRWMLNFGRTEHPHARRTWEHFYNKEMCKQFFRDYEKLYSRVFPVYNKPDTAGNYAKEMTQRPMRRYYKSGTSKEKLDIRFYPEGGNLVAGTIGRVAFEANDGEGRHIDIQMDITDSKGTVVAQAGSRHRGRGMFDLPCPADSKSAFRARFTYKDEIYEFPLPPIQSDGCAIRVGQQDDNLSISLATRGVKASLLGISVICNGLVVAYRECAPLEGSIQTVSIPLQELPTGVNQLTVFDKEGRIYADRLYFVNRHDYDTHTVTVGGADKEFSPFAPIDLELALPEGTTQADISLTVRDASTDERLYDNSSILTEMLLGSELQGFIEDPMYYFENDDETHRFHLDLLMMVQGWRRYVWKDMAGLGNFQLAFMPEKQQTLAGSVHKSISYDTDVDIVAGNGEVYDRDNGTNNNTYTTEETDSDNNRTENQTSEEYPQEPQAGSSTLQHEHGTEISALNKEVLVKAEYVDGQDIVETEQTTQKGRFYMVMPTFYEYCTLFLHARDTTQFSPQKEEQWMKYFKDEERYSDFYVKRDLFYPQFARPYSFYEDELPDNSFDRIETNSAGISDHELPVVTIRTKRGGLRRFDKTKPALVIDAYEAYNHLCDWGFFSGKFYPGGFARSIAMAYIGDMGMEREFDLVERHDGRIHSNSQKQAKQVTTSKHTPYIQDIPTPKSNPGGFEQQRKYGFLKNLDKIYIYTDYCPREQGSYKYEQSNQPEVTVDLHLLPLDAQRITYRDRYYFPLPGLSTCEEFYSPDYSVRPPAGQTDYRRTLLWMPEVKIDADGKAHIRLYNNGKPGLIRVRAEGITPDGRPLSGGYEPK